MTYIGNAKAQAHAQAAITRRGGVVLLLSGPTHVGKHALARHLVAQALGRPLKEAEPDVLDVTQETTVAGTLSIATAKKAVAHLARTPFAGDRTFLILTQADRLTIEAANALLVTLESPPAHAVCILTTNNRARVLPTVRSRCLPITLAPVPSGELAAGLQANGVKPAELDTLVTLAQGLPGRALQAHSDAVFRRSLKKVQGDLATWQTSDLLTRLDLAARYGKDRQSAAHFLSEAVYTLAPVWRSGLLRADRQLTRNVPARAVLEAFAMLLP